jgi:VIT1/CCC1 family predicted Fe2+/Mn2+ transporter
MQRINRTGLITGIAASLSMSASEYLSTRTEEDHTKHPVKAALYTGVAYVFTVALLIAPYLVLNNSFVSLGLSLAFAIDAAAFCRTKIVSARDCRTHHV